MQSAGPERQAVAGSVQAEGQAVGRQFIPVRQGCFVDIEHDGRLGDARRLRDQPLPGLRADGGEIARVIARSLIGEQLIFITVEIGQPLTRCGCGAAADSEDAGDDAETWDRSADAGFAHGPVSSIEGW